MSKQLPRKVLAGPGGDTSDLRSELGEGYLP